MFNTTINDNSKNTGFFNNNLKNEVNITTKKGLFKTKVTVSSSKEIKRKKENDRMLDFNKIEKRNWRIKRTQLNPNSDYVTVPTYFIPYSMADATMDCSNFFNQYELEIN